MAAASDESWARGGHGEVRSVRRIDLAENMVPALRGAFERGVPRQLTAAADGRDRLLFPHHC